MNACLHWFAMNGYGNYIWSAYGLVFAVLVINAISIKWLKRRTQKRLLHWYKRQA